MADIILFPLNDERALNQALVTSHAYYLKAGLSQQGADAAIEELRPALLPFVKGYEAVFELSAAAGLNGEQMRLVTEAHNECVQATLAHFTEQLGLAVCTIAGLIGCKYE